MIFFSKLQLPFLSKRKKKRNLLNTVADSSVTQALKDISGGVVESFSSKILPLLPERCIFLHPV